MFKSLFTPTKGQEAPGKMSACSGTMGEDASATAEIEIRAKISDRHDKLPDAAEMSSPPASAKVVKSVQGREGHVTWDGRPHHPLMRVRWLDTGDVTDIMRIRVQEQEERRVANDGRSYTKAEFQEFYQDSWQRSWDAASPDKAQGEAAESNETLPEVVDLVSIGEEEPSKVDLSNIVRAVEQEALDKKRAAWKERDVNPKEEKLVKPTQPRGPYDDSDEEFELLCEPPAPLKPNLDLKYLGQLIAANDEEMQQLHGQNVVVLLGKTGTGKSTLIQFIASRKLVCKPYRRQTMERFDSSASRDVYEAEDPVKGFDIGHDQQSQTKQIKHYVRQSGGPDDGENHAVVYVDSAGYEDTAGMEVDISTSVAFRKLAEVCKSLRFVALINSVSILEDKGGPIRSLVKLMSSMVHNFDEHKLAFTFLFTHTNVLRETATMELAEVRKWLRDRIGDTVQGTNDESSKAVLKWIRKCLKKGNPCVEVFHPEKSDRVELIKTIERFSLESLEGDDICPAIGLAEGQSPADVVRCGLTWQIHTLIKQNLEQLLQELRVALESIDVAELSTLLHAFEHLHRQTALDCVSDAYAQASKDLQTHAQKMNDEVFALIHRGTNDEDEFCAKDASKCLKLIAVLGEIPVKQFSGSNLQESGESILAELRTRIHSLKQRVSGCFEGDFCLSSFLGIFPRMSKLWEWAEAHDEFQLVAIQSTATVDEYIQRLCRSVYQPVNDVEAHVKKFQRLEQLHAHIHRLQSLGVNGQDVPQMYLGVCNTLGTMATDHMQAAHAAWCKISTSIGGPTLPQVKEELKPHIKLFVERSMGLERLFQLLKDKDVNDDLVEHARIANHKCYTEANDEMDRQCLQAQQLLDDGFLGSEIIHIWILKELLDTQTQSHPNHSHGRICYKKACDAVVAKVRGWEQQLHAVSSQMEADSLRGPAIHRQLLENLSKSTWIDEHISDEHEAVSRTVGHIKERYHSYAKQTCQQLQDSLEAYFQQTGSRNAALERLRTVHPELEKLTEIGSADPSLQDECTRCHEDARSFVDEWLAKQRDCLSGLSVSLHSVRDLPAADVNQVLQASEDLEFMKPIASNVSCFCDPLRAKLQEYRIQIKELFDSDGKYEVKCIVLNVVAKWQEEGFSLIVAQWPSSGELQDILRSQIQQHAASIRKSMERDPDLANSELDILRAACGADKLIGGQAAHEVANLKELIEIRQTSIDNVFNDQIADRNFSGMYEELAPLASSQDTLKQQRFQQKMSALASCVTSIVSSGEAVECGTQVVQSVELLEQIDGGLRSLLQQHKTLNVEEAVRKLKTRANDHFRLILKQYESALNVSNYLDLVRHGQAMSAYCDVAKSLLNQEVQQRAEQARVQTAGTMDDVRKLIDEFLDGILKPAQDRADTTKLCIILNNMAASVGNPELRQLETFYMEQTNKLSETMYARHLDMCQHVEKAPMYKVAMEVYTYLQKEWDKGLRNHVKDLRFNIKEVLEDFQKKLTEQHEFLKASFWTPTMIDRHVAYLDQLSNNSWFWVDTTQYRDQQCLLDDQLDRYGQTMLNELKTGSYEVAASYLKSLDYVQQKLSPHLKPGIGNLHQTMDRANSTIVIEFNNLLENLCKVLQEDNVEAFDRLFVQCHQFVCHLAHFCPHILTKLPRLHDPMFNHVEAKISRLAAHVEKFEFGAVFELISVLRRFAFVFTGIYPLYRENFGPTQKDKCLDEIDKMCEKHFNAKVLSPIGIHYAILGIPAHADGDDVHKAYHRKCREHHPDTHARRNIHCDSPHAMQQRIEDANSGLKQRWMRDQYQKGIASLFSVFIKDIPKSTQKAILSVLEEKDYPRAKKVLLALSDLKSWKDLAQIDVEKTYTKVNTAIKDHIHELQNDMDKHWKARKLGQLHDEFACLEKIDEVFGAHREVYSDAWKLEIEKKIEAEIENVANIARSHIKPDEAEAEAAMMDFASQLITLGQILDELPRFKTLSTERLHNLLETCQTQPFGFAYMFKVGILLEQGRVGRRGRDGKVVPEDYEWEVMNRFGITDYTSMPSVYGASNFRFLDQEGGNAVKIVSDSEYFLAITDQANQKQKLGRAVIVIFEGLVVLEGYVASSYYKKVNNKNLLDERQSREDRQYVIKKAATAGQITFTTSAFARGTDFVSSDARLDDQGGVHVIQTYVSIKKSEELQAQGRTARQGKKGTYSMILQKNWLHEEFGIESNQVKHLAPDKLYELIDAQRQLRHADMCKKIEENLATATTRDALTHAYFDAVLAGKRNDAVQKFHDLYKETQGKCQQSRMMCLFDATGSMEGLWNSAKEHIGEMLSRIEEIGGTNIELMWVAYRDYSDADLLEKSAWTNQPSVLQTFINGISCYGGGDEPEAVEHALAEVRSEHKSQPVTRVLLIADAPPHFEKKGEKLTAHDKCLTTDYMCEAEELAALGIPVYAFYIGDYMKEFEYIAATTGGTVQELRTENLIDVVCLNALEDMAIGGSELVAEYKARCN